MRVEATATTVSWIPSEALSGLLRLGLDVGVAHHDAPPPDVLGGSDGGSGLETVEALRDQDRLRFANVLGAWAEFEDGRLVDHGYSPGSGLVIGSTTVRLAGLGATFSAVPMPVLRPEPTVDAGGVRLTQTVGGRTGVPMPRPVPHAPFVLWQAPIVWTTVAVALHPDGRAEVSMPGASAFPRHWLYGPDGSLAAKSSVTDQDSWLAHSFGSRTPWGDQDSAARVSPAESELERRLSQVVMRGGPRPEVRRLPVGAVVTQQGEPGDELFLLLDGVLAVEVDGRRLAEVGPGAVLGERALLEGGVRTSTLVATTPVRLAVAPVGAVDLDRLRDLAEMHRREG